MKTNIVIGLGYGDEGKGLTSDYLCQQYEYPLVIRFSGGHQAGHTVVTEDGKRHVFSSFGSGSLRGIPTYWSKYCTLYPIAFYNESLALRQMKLDPKIFIDAQVMITTPYDVFYNRNTETNNQHGSCGVGVGATVERNEGPNKLYALDLLYPKVVEQKLRAIETYYTQKKGQTMTGTAFNQTLTQFLQNLKDIRPLLNIVHEAPFFTSVKFEKLYDALIFEGSQGILLDQDFGFFPNVTRAYVTSRNAMDIIYNNMLPLPKIYYITRAYQTRHGNGFLKNEHLELDINPNPQETNQFNEWQGAQRLAPLDIDLLNYALACDNNYSSRCEKHFVVTCLDQMKGKIPITINETLHHFTKVEEIVQHLNTNFVEVLESWSDCSAYLNHPERITC